MANADRVHELAQLIRRSTIQATSADGRLLDGFIDLGFFQVSIEDAEGKPTVAADEFLTALRAAFEQRTGEFADMDLEGFRQGPSYIALGAWLGDQGVAIALIGVGALLGLWDVASPETLGITGAEANQMRGMGFLFPSVGAGSPLAASKGAAA